MLHLYRSGLNLGRYNLTLSPGDSKPIQKYSKTKGPQLWDISDLRKGNKERKTIEQISVFSVCDSFSIPVHFHDQKKYLTVTLIKQLGTNNLLSLTT